MAQKRVKEKPKASNRKGRGNATFEKVAMVDLQQMSLPEIKKIAKRVFNTANKRVERLEKNEAIYSSPAYKSMKQSGGRFSMRGKSRNELLKEIKRAYGFMENKTSSEKGAKQFYEELKKSFEAEGVNLQGWQNRDIDKFLRAYQQLTEKYPKVANRNFKYKYMEEIANNISSGLEPEEVISKMEALVEDDTIYEQNVEADNGDFFRQLE